MHHSTEGVKKQTQLTSKDVDWLTHVPQAKGHTGVGSSSKNREISPYEHVYLDLQSPRPQYV